MPLIVVNERAPYVHAGMVHMPETVLDIDRRIKFGDESGWRGDPSMRLYWNPTSMEYEVVGTDAMGVDYLAASHHTCDHTLLIKLVAGDPRKHNVPAEILARNAKRRADIDAAEREQRLAIADKMEWAIRQDLGQHLGGRKRMHAVTDDHGKAS